MHVALAGINIDTILLEKIKTSLGEEAAGLTPETLSASYARISRSKKTIRSLRESAVKEVEKARRSNKKIIFEMGHASVAEHAVLNFDVSGISRYAVEFIENFRLASFTEKSQRYVLFKEEYKVPKEILNGKYEKEYRDTIHTLASIYSEIYEKLTARNIGEESAKEDSRYATSLAALTQFGMTINARSLEYMIVRLKNSSLSELKDFASGLYGSIRDTVPSLVKYIEQDPYYKEFYGSPEKDSCDKDSYPETAKTEMHSSVYPEVILSDYDNAGENKILASMLFRNGGRNFEHYISLLNKSSKEYKYSLLKPLFKEMKAYHPLPRFFELADLTFQVECSASAYAQLKRHRMTVQISQHYNPGLGYTVPPTIKSSGLEDLIAKAYEISTKLFYKIRSEAGQAAQYILTNAHRRRVLVKLDIRELYHISRLRGDKYAQWEIRKVAEKMVELARDKYPLVTLLACGKDRFTACRQELDQDRHF